MEENEMTAKHFKKIPISFLWEGLVLADEVYNSNGTVMLLPSNEIITEKKLARLTGFLDENEYITISGASYEIIMNERKERTFSQIQQSAEDRTGYTSLMQNIKQILQLSRTMKSIEQNVVKEIAEDILEKFSSPGAEGIFQCIDVPRPMDEALQRHSLNVAFLNGTIGQWLSLPKTEIRQLTLAGLLHDIGKTKIADDILNAPRRLTPNEFAIIKKHPIYSYELLGPSIDENVRLAVRQHHEKLDGTGYPDGLAGDDIPLFSRITTVSDIYDALVSARCYKSSQLPFDVLERFASGALGAVDPNISRFFVKHMVAHYKNQQVILSDGSLGSVAYIPPNDISHPIVIQDNIVRQVDDAWFCVRVV